VNTQKGPTDRKTGIPVNGDRSETERQGNFVLWMTLAAGLGVVIAVVLLVLFVF
jgi:hypothetical protein